MNRIGEVLKQVDLKQVELAKRMGTSKSTVSQWCSNTSQPNLSTLYRIAEALDCDIADLLLSRKNISAQ
jgi:transcriptional regulator with XRE-family HTH domain